LQSGTIALVACFCLALIGSEAWQLWRVHAANIQQTEIVTSNTARSMAEQADSTLKTADTVVASLVERLEAEGTGLDSRIRFHHLMTSLAAALPAIHEMGITDSKGNAIVKSLVADPHGLNYAEREYFRFHAAHADRQTFIGQKVKSKIDGSTNVTVTRRYNNPDGSFAGVVVTSVSMTFFQRLFDQLQAKSGGVVALLADDGSILVRSPPAPDAGDRVGPELERQMRDHPSGASLAYVSGIDGVRRLGSYQHLSQFPMSALVSQSEWDVQSTWRAELHSHAIILGCVILVVSVLGGCALRATQKLNAQAMQDGLTGLANRRSFDETIEREVRRADRSGQPVSVIMIDIDHFKAYNDCHGHPGGDECLRVAAHAIQDCLRREGDLAARYGGEEIAVVLPGTDARRAYGLAERMRLEVRGLALRQAPGIGGNLTLSAGVATYMPGRSVGAAQGLVAAADAALYAAKAGGRDRVEPQPSPSGANRRDAKQAAETVGAA
jgi:diguanylate cyclase (GGDEF)-like protein